MSIAISQPLSLEQFLQLSYIEDSPAWEFSQGVAVQKPMPGEKHSRLQSRLGGAINATISGYEALPELRCTFGGRLPKAWQSQTIVPDLVVLPENQIPVDANSEIISTGITIAPMWMIEILSPDQSQMRVTRNILHSLRHGGQLGWLIDPGERVVLVYHPNALPEELTKTDRLPCLPNIGLRLTVEQMFSWLKVVDGTSTVY